MAQRGIGRSSLTVGLLVLTMLIGGRIVGTWRTGQVSHLAQADRRATNGHARSTSHQAVQPASPTPTPTPSPSASTGQPSLLPSPTPSTSPPSSTKPHIAAQPDPAFGAIRTTGTVGVALTFDDGPHASWTPQVLDLLRQQGVKATFCVVGVQVRKNPQLVVRIVNEGHTLCNHSWAHDIDMGKKTPDQIRADLARTSAEIRKAVPDATIPYYRQPGGAWTQGIVNVAKQLGMTPLHWSVDPTDWSRPGTKAIIKRVTQHTSAGSIILVHDGGGDRAQTLAACRDLIPRLKQHYELIPLP